tara:strand:+ start:547 stop:735 length:189 start_codon:yes stop_codon:yes gene_type:complete
VEVINESVIKNLIPLGKTEKHGNYIKAVGYLSVRAKIILPKVGKNRQGTINISTYQLLTLIF